MEPYSPDVSYPQMGIFTHSSCDYGDRNADVPLNRIRVLASADALLHSHAIKRGEKWDMTS